ncbi:ABC transporter permease [Candidatus Gottesmanbacteria bacterium]|nr:ABC transporter permease [Candidatus Gottesmanbacteria bacterium]
MTSSVSLWQRIRRTPYQTIAAVFMIFITLFVMAVFLLIATGSSAILSYLESKPQLTIFFKDEKNKTSIEQLTGKLQSSGKVASISYVSKDQALAIYREQNKNDPLLLEMVTADILPSSLEISAISPKYLIELSEMVKDEPGIDEVVFQKDVVDTLISWTSTVRKVGAVFILFLAVATFFILFTTIGMKIAFHKEEIEILKLVGATSWYIKKPFIYEGLVYGIAGAILAWVTIFCVLLYISPFMTSFLKGIPSLTFLQIEGIIINFWPFAPFLFVVLLMILMLAGLIIGLTGSFFAVSRYMKS